MRAVLIFLLFCFPIIVSAQSKVVWDVTYNAKSESVEFNAKIEKGWHMYSQNLNKDLGPVPTEFSFNDQKEIKLVGKTQEPEPIKKYDANFEGDVSYFEGDVIFTQKIRPKTETELTGTITYMVCNGEMCLPPTDQEFTVRID